MEELKKLKKDSAITEDDLASFEKDVQKSLDAKIAEIDKIMANKEAEIMQV